LVFEANKKINENKNVKINPIVKLINATLELKYNTIIYRQLIAKNNM
jgi:hypothetical protein